MAIDRTRDEILCFEPPSISGSFLFQLVPNTREKREGWVVRTGMSETLRPTAGCLLLFCLLVLDDTEWCTLEEEDG